MSSSSLQNPLVSIPIYSAVVFGIIASPTVFKLTDATVGKLIKLDLASPAGLPTYSGLVVHALVAALLMYAYLSMYS
jgi:hypothetical protein